MDRPSPAFRVPRLWVTPTLAAQSVAKARRGRPRAWPSNIRATRSIAATATAGSRAPRTAPAAQTATRVRPAVGSRGAGVLDVVCWGGAARVPAPSAPLADFVALLTGPRSQAVARVRVSLLRSSLRFSISYRR